MQGSRKPGPTHLAVCFLSLCLRSSHHSRTQWQYFPTSGPWLTFIHSIHHHVTHFIEKWAYSRRLKAWYMFIEYHCSCIIVVLDKGCYTAEPLCNPWYGCYHWLLFIESQTDKWGKQEPEKLLCPKAMPMVHPPHPMASHLLSLYPPLSLSQCARVSHKN